MCRRLCVFVSLFCSPAFAADQKYAVHRDAGIVVIEDTKNQVAVSILPSVGNIAFSMKVKGQEVLRWPYASVEEFKSRPALSGIPFVGPWANRLDEQAFYANGKRYAFDMDLGNVRGAIPIHGFLSTNNQWHVVEVKADGKSAWVTSRLEFFKQPLWMKQFPFAHTIEMTHRLQDGVLQVVTKITNMSAEPMPVAVGFHPYYRLTDSRREEWIIAVGARKHWKLSTTNIFRCAFKNLRLVFSARVEYETLLNNAASSSVGCCAANPNALLLACDRPIAVQGSAKSCLHLSLFSADKAANAYDKNRRVIRQR